MDDAGDNITVIRQLTGLLGLSRSAACPRGSAPASAALLAHAASRDSLSGDGCNYRRKQLAFAELDLSPHHP